MRPPVPPDLCLDSAQPTSKQMTDPTTPERKTETAPDSGALGVLGVGDPVIGIRLLGTNTEYLLPDNARITIGADPECDIVLDGAFVSSLHCLLERRDRGILLIDQSKNGTMRDGRRGDEFELEDGVPIMIGTLLLMPFGERSVSVHAPAFFGAAGIDREIRS